jgi:formamidopyrimidine-DNA glycosylase
LAPSHFVGFGRVYRHVARWEGALAHDRDSSTLSTQEVRRLYRAIHEVLQTAMKQRGSSLDDATPDQIFDDEGEPVEHLSVYGREGQPCLRCRRPIRRTKVKGDLHTFHCEGCQM